MPEETVEDTSATLKDAWSIRPCEMYKHEYDDCTSFKARFHQYFVHGEDTDCSQWKVDYDNCCRFQDSNGNNLTAGAAIIQSEAERRKNRMQAHYANTTWQKRASPPPDWAKPLPEWLEKRNENTYLQIKQMEMNGQTSTNPNKTEESFCVLM